MKKPVDYPNILLDALEHGIMIVDEAFNVMYWNQWLEINTGHDYSNMVGKSLLTFYPEIDYRTLQRKIRTTLRLNSPTFYDASLTNRFIPISRNKISSSLLSTMQLQVTISPYIIDQGMVMIAVYDISDLHELKLTLQKQMEKIAHLNSELQHDKQIIDDNLLIVKTDGDFHIIEVSKAFNTFFGFEKNELEDCELQLICSDKIPVSEYAQMKNTLQNGQRWSGEIEIISKNGQAIWVDAVVTPWSNNSGSLSSYTAIYHDITDKKRLELLATTDLLTKLSNRYKFDEIFDIMLMREHWKTDDTFAIVMADIDHFKQINDIYGHPRGDEVLVKIAKVLSQTLQTGDVIARWGGEEFIFLLSHVSASKAIHVAEKLRMAVEQLRLFVDVRLSFGVSLFVEGDTHATLLNRADTALYKAKKNGRNRVEIV
jgi:diguanylate cyclase (GGDEF)-like protein/PAS domain S-box-containing protein